MRISLKNEIIKEVISVRVISNFKEKSEEPEQVILEFKLQHSVKFLLEYLIFCGANAIREMDKYESIWLSYAEKDMTHEEVMVDVKMRLKQLLEKGYADFEDLKIVDDASDEGEDLDDNLFV